MIGQSRELEQGMEWRGVADVVQQFQSLQGTRALYSSKVQCGGTSVVRFWSGSTCQACDSGQKFVSS